MQDANLGLVLLIEDDDDHAELLRRALQNSGPPHELVRVEDGEQALGFLLDGDSEPSRLARCVLVLLDLRLPRVDGLEVLRRLQQTKRRVPIVVLTTSENDGDIAAAYACGAHAYLVKPVDFASFGELARGVAQFWLVWNRLPIAS